MMRQINLLLLLTLQVVFLFCGCSKTESPQNIYKKSLTNENWLEVSGNQIINQKGDTVYLRGFGLGGMLHMEIFIDGYSANEETMKEGLRKVL